MEEKQKVIRQRVAVLQVIGILLVLFSVAYLIYHNNKNKATIIQQAVRIDSTKFLRDQLNDSLISIEKENIAILSIIDRYLKIEPIDLDSIVLNDLVVDTLSRFFLHSNYPKAKIMQAFKNENKLHPNYKLEYDLETASISRFSDQTFKVLFNASYNSPSQPKKDIIYDVRLTKDYKIYYVRNYFPPK